MKTITILILLTFFSTLPYTQNPETGEIQGMVKDESGNGFPGVTITITTDIRTGTLTNTDGRFVISDIPAGEYLLEARFIGYEKKKVEVVVKAGEILKIDFTLKEEPYEMPQVNIFAKRKEGIFKTVPGSLTYIDKMEIDYIKPINSNEVLRRSPGVHIVEEEGVGMRMNFAIRGLDAARSRSTLMLEDGIPLALAPYGEPEMYYAPAMEKMAGVEILKGSGSVLYGPQTIGGVVNFITKDPPAESEGTLSLNGGQGAFLSGLLAYGNTVGKAGFQVNYLHRRADNIGPTMFRLHDLSSKFKFQISNRSYLGVKIGVYKEVSNSTYVGMTQPMFDSGNYDFKPIAPLDRLNVSRYNLSASHNYYINDNTTLTSTLFGYTTTRDWQRQDFTYNSFDADGNLNPKPSNYSGVTWGDESIEEGAIYMLNTSGNRNRTYEIAGAESRITSSFNIGSIDNEFTGGIRLLHERAYEQRINGSKPDARSGEIVNDEVRTGLGTSAYVHNSFRLTSKFSITAGMRLEIFNDTRHILRSLYEINDKEVLRDTSIIASNSIAEIIPGAGFNFQPTESFGIFGGVHRGFAPPRTKDAISAIGEVHELSAEKSWNFELGLRAEATKGIRYEVTGFYMDFSNQVIPVAEHAGGVGSGITNAGATLHWGVEAAGFIDFKKILNWESFNIMYDANISYVQARFNSERYMKNNEGELVNVNGNRTPYAPEWLVSSALTFEHRTGIATRFTYTYASDQYTDPFNSVQAHNNGREGLIPAYKLVDFTLLIPVERLNITFNVSAKNLFNERYIASRRPQGIMLGNPRLLTGGFTFDF